MLRLFSDVFIPIEPRVIEASLECGFHDLEVGRQVEVPGREQTMMADFKKFAQGAGLQRVAASFLLPDIRQDWVAHGLERLSDQT